MPPRITTRCPSCHSQTLDIDDGGRLICTWSRCKDPTLIHRDEEFDALKAKLAEEAERIFREGWYKGASAPIMLDKGEVHKYYDEDYDGSRAKRVAEGKV